MAETLEDRIEFLETVCFERLMYIRDLENKFGVRPSNRYPSKMRVYDVERVEAKKKKDAAFSRMELITDRSTIEKNDKEKVCLDYLGPSLSNYCFDFERNLYKRNKKVNLSKDDTYRVNKNITICIPKNWPIYLLSPDTVYKCVSEQDAVDFTGESLCIGYRRGGWNSLHGWARPYLINK